MTQPVTPRGIAAGLRSRAAPWYVLVMMCLVYTLSITDRYVISTVLESVRLELHLTDGAIAFLTGVSLAIFYVTLGFPVSLLLDRRSRRDIISLALIAWSAMTLFTGLARTPVQLLASRIGVGIGEAAGTPGANSLLSDYFPAALRPMALTVFSLGAPIGAWLAADVAGQMADHHGWRSVFLFLGAPGIAAGALIYLTVREPQRGRLDQHEDGPPPSFFETLRFWWRQRSAVHLMVGSAITALWGWGLLWFTPTFLIRTYGITAGEAGAVTGPIHLIGGGLATVLTGWLVAQPAMSDPRRVMRLMGTVIGLATAVSFVIYWTHSLALARALFWIFIPSIYFYIGPCFGILNNLAQPRMRAMFCALTLFLANVGNLIIAPQFVGSLSDWLASGHVGNAASLRLAMLCLVPTGFWAAAHYFLAARHALADQERATGASFEAHADVAARTNNPFTPAPRS